MAASGTSDPAASVWDSLARPIRALEGDRQALREMVGCEAAGRAAVELGLGPALALAADRAGIDASEGWRQALTASMSAWLLVDRAGRQVAAALGGAGVRWAPIKGWDVATRFYAEREARPTADLDLLVGRGDFATARQALEAAGWCGLADGERQEAYLRDEGYAWQATGPAPAVVEVHFRLWGLVPEGIAGAMLAAAAPEPSLGGSGYRLAPPDAYLLAAVHAWTKERPRGLLDWLDLERIARWSRSRQEGGTSSEGTSLREGGTSRSTLESASQQEGGTSGESAFRQEGGTSLGEGVVRRAVEWGLELPVVLSAGVGERLWVGGVHGEIVEGLTPRLAAVEGRVWRRLIERGPGAVAYRDVVLARLRAGRPSRMGWRSVWRRLWPHPGVVAVRTPRGWAWPRRRLAAVLAALRGAGA